jgi:ABC-type antimicrobial peptide transport system permease subunit
MDERMRATLGPDRTMAALTAAFAAVALLLASVGLHAVLAHGVTARTVEFGIRMAVGADRGAIARLVLGQGLRLVAIGIACGLGAAALGGRVVASQLYGVSPRDPIAYGVVALVFVLVGGAASLIPAIRAARTDPIECLSAR